MNIRSAILQASAPDLASCPPSELPEFAFIGRSNVGKSSLVNLLTRHSHLAKVSATPGKTRLINLFTINSQWTLADLPGYGYAKVAQKQRRKFASFTTDYLTQRPNLLGTFVLLDSRLTPQAIDLEFLAWMIEHGLPFILLFTKIDKLSPTAVRANVDAFLLRLRELSPESPHHILCSSKNGDGRSEILATITGAIAQDPV